MASVLNTGIDGIIQQKDANRKEVIHGVQEKARNLEKAPLPIRIILWPVTFTIKVTMEAVRWAFLIPHMIWHRLVDDSSDKKTDALIVPGAPLVPGASYQPPKLPFRILDRFLQGNVMLAFQEHVQPVLSRSLAAPINVAIPWVLDQQVLTFVVPYAAWKALVGYFGNEEQMHEAGGYNADMALINARVARDKDAIEAERDELQETVSVLKRQLSDLQFQRQTTDFSHVNGAT